MKQEAAEETEIWNVPARTLPRALSLPLRSCCCPYCFVREHRSTNPCPLCHNAARSADPARMMCPVNACLAGMASLFRRLFAPPQQPSLMFTVMAVIWRAFSRSSVKTSAGSRSCASVWECGG